MSDSDDRSRMSAIMRISRLRLVQAVLSMAALVVVAVLVGQALTPGYWWIGVGLATLLSATLIEPYFTDVRTALANAVAACVAMLTVNRPPIEDLWWLYLAFSLTVVLCAILSLALPLGRVRAVAKWLATRMGRARVLGYGALSLEVLRVAIEGSTSEAVTLAIGLAVAMFVSSLDLNRLLAVLPRGLEEGASVELATEPNLLLLSSRAALEAGARVRVTGDKGSSEGTILTPLAHRSGSRFQAVLDKPWWTVVSKGDTECTIASTESTIDAVGYAAEGSTERLLEVHPVTTLSYGDSLLLDRADGMPILYQVSGLRLEKNAWDGSSVIEPRARAVQVGAAEADGMIGFTPYLPKPYQLLLDAKTQEIAVPAPYVRIGLVAGSEIEVGINPEAALGSHMAILGMSGMGKTSIARRLSSVLKDHSAVVAVDATGEYVSRLGMEGLPGDSELTTHGEWVEEPKGELPYECEKLIERFMTVASAEYAKGAPGQRTLLMEEAHSLLPEWNVATKTQSDSVNKSCRYILQARKFGMSFVFVSQRTAVISKSALSQCESYIIFRTLDQTSLDYMEGVVGQELREAVSSLRRYQAVCVGPAFNTSSPVIVDLDPLCQTRGCCS